MAAKNYTEILALVNAGNQMGLSNTIKRDYGIPLDFTSVQPSFDDAVIYAAENTKAYIGQPLSVGGKLYIINDVAAAEKHVVGEKEYDNYLVEVGSATEGDGVTIDLDEGVLTLHGFESALTGYLPRKAEDGSLEWVPISAVVQGDGNKVTTLTSEDSSVTITKKTDTDDSLVYDLSVEAYDDSDLQTRVKAIEDDYLKGEDKYDDTALVGRVAAIEGDYLKTADKYDDTALANRVKALEDEERYDETPLANRVSTIEGTVGNAEGGLVKDLADEVTRAQEAEKALGERIDAIDYIDADELSDAIKDFATDSELEAGLALKADKTALEELAATVDAFLTGDGTEAALDSLKELIAYIESHDDADIAGILEDIQAIENKLAGIDSTVVAYVTAAIDALKIGDYAKAADLTDLAGRVEALEAKPFDTYAIKSDVEAEFAKYTTTETLTSQLAAKADADKVVANDTFETFKGENTAAIGTAKSEAIAAAKTETETQVGALEDAVAETYATKTELSDAVDGIETALEDYAKTADVEAELAKKIETAQITHTTNGTTEGVTVEGTSLKIVVDAYTKEQVYTKSETDAEITKKITSINGGESAGEVKSELVDYRDALNSEIWGEGARSWTTKTEVDGKTVVTYTPQYGTTSRIDTLAEEVATAKTQADKGVADAKKVSDDLAALTTGAVATNTGDITSIKGRLDTLETAKGDHEQRITAAEGKITALEAADVVINSTLTTIGTDITGLKTRDEQLAALIQGNTDKFANYSDTTAMNKAIEDAIAAIPATDLSKHATIEYVDGELAKKADASAVYTKEEADAAFMNQDEVDARISALIDAANNEDTIKNLNDLVNYVNENASDIAELVTATNANTAKLAGIDTTVTDYVDGAIAAIVMPKASEEVTLAEDGTLGLGKVSTDKLVQGTDTLVIDGGNA